MKKKIFCEGDFYIVYNFVTEIYFPSRDASTEKDREFSISISKGFGRSGGGREMREGRGPPSEVSSFIGSLPSTRDSRELFTHVSGVLRKGYRTL